MNYYKHHLGDYDGATMHLTWTQDLAYTRLLRAYYRREKPIPGDLAEACRLTRARSRMEKEAVASCLREFFELINGEYRNKRCDEEIEKYQRMCATNRSTARQRNVNENSTTRSPNQEPITMNHKPRKKNPPLPPLEGGLSASPENPKTNGAWWQSESETLAKAREFGIETRAGEDWPQLRNRIRSAINAKKAA